MSGRTQLRDNDVQIKFFRHTISPISFFPSKGKGLAPLPLKAFYLSIYKQAK